MTDPVWREQGGHSVWEYHNPGRDLCWAEMMPEPLDWDAWCRQRAALPAHDADTAVDGAR